MLLRRLRLLLHLHRSLLQHSRVPFPWRLYPLLYLFLSPVAFPLFFLAPLSSPFPYRLSWPQSFCHHGWVTQGRLFVVAVRWLPSTSSLQSTGFAPSCLTGVPRPLRRAVPLSLLWRALDRHLLTIVHRVATLPYHQYAFYFSCPFPLSF